MKFALDEWREIARPFYQVLPQEPDADAGIRLEATTVENLLLTGVEAPRQVLIHDPAIQKGVCHDYLLFERFLSGGGWGEVADVGFTAVPERLHLIDMSRRYVSSKHRSRSQGVLIPHAAVGYVPGQDPVFSSIEIRSPAGRVLAVAHEALVSAREEMEPGDGSIIADIFLDLVCRLMLDRLPRNGTAEAEEAALGLRVREHVTARLDAPDLDIQRLATAFGVSRATVYRHFEAEGGITRYIRNRRLDRCFFELAGARRTRGSVKAVAERWQFNDASHFNRLFRERFGMSPSACMATPDATGTCPSGDLVRLSRTWLDQIRSG